MIGGLRTLEAELNVDPPPALRRVRPPDLVERRQIHAGDWASTVPGECRPASGSRRTPACRRQRLRARIEQIVAEASGDTRSRRARGGLRGFAARGVRAAARPPARRRRCRRPTRGRAARRRRSSRRPAPPTRASSGRRYPGRVLRARTPRRARHGGAGVPSERGADRTGDGDVHQGLVRRVMTWAVVVARHVVLIVAARLVRPPNLAHDRRRRHRRRRTARSAGTAGPRSRSPGSRRSATTSGRTRRPSTS